MTPTDTAPSPNLSSSNTIPFTSQPTSALTPWPPHPSEVSPTNIASSAGGTSTLHFNPQPNSASDNTSRGPSEGRIEPDISSRSSSNAKLQPNPAPPAADPTTADDQAENLRPASKGSISGRRRNGSVAGSAQAKQVLAVTPTAAEQNTSGTNAEAVGKTRKPKKGGVSRFLSFLNCCSAPENANTVENDNQAVPMKNAKKGQSVGGRQATPILKPEAESSTAESKETADEKIGGTPYSELTSTAEPKMVDSRPREDISVAEPTIPADTGRSGEEKDVLQAQSKSESQPLSLMPVLSEEHGYGEGTSGRNLPQGSQTEVFIEPPTPTALEQGEVAINDRTPQQAKRDSDIEMIDAPPIAPGVDEPAETTENRAAAPVPTNLPPPPPLTGRDLQANSATNPNRGTTAVGALNEKQQWLLPPIQPRFQGKKCLVLDLDETLVHSSFKVGSLAMNCISVY